MSSERFHKAARDGDLKILKEATRKDCNVRDDAGMTPTLWAALEGDIDALRLLVSRGGDPDKSDYFGNTALHLAAAKGHQYCVEFLVKFGCNIWSLDIDRHSARVLAAINGRVKIVEFLDLAETDQKLNSPKKSRIQRERAEKEASKSFKEYMKREELALKKLAEYWAEKDQKKMPKYRAKFDTDPGTESIIPHRPSIFTFGSSTKPSPTFSDIVGTTAKRNGSAVCRKALAKKAGDDFKIVEVEVNGNKSVRSLTGLRRDSEIMYVGTYENQAQQMGRRGKISDVWDTLSKAQSMPDLLGDRSFCEEEENEDFDAISRPRETTFLQEPASIFNRPGFGSVAFRKPITSTFDNLPASPMDVHQQNGNSCANGSVSGSVNCHRASSNSHHHEDLSIGSAGSLARRQRICDDDILSEDDEADEQWTPLQRFLAANLLSAIHPILESEQIDLEALMLLTEADIASLKLPLGPRRKLINAIASRRRAFDARENAMKDSRL